jgi:hypothetical protein
MVNNTFNPITSGYEELNEIIAELGSVSISNGCDLTVDAGLNGPSKIVLTCNEYEIEIQSGGDAPASLGSNRGAPAPSGGQAGKTSQGGELHDLLQPISS